MTIIPTDKCPEACQDGTDLCRSHCVQEETMHNTNIPCGCLIEYEGDQTHQDYSINWCPLHASASELLEVLKRCVGIIPVMKTVGTPLSARTRAGVLRDARAALGKALDTSE